MIKEMVYTETNNMHFDNKNLLGAKVKTGGAIPFNEDICGKTNQLDAMFCTGLRDIFGLEKTNQFFAAKPVTYTFAIEDNGEYKCTFAEEILVHIIENSSEEEAVQVKSLHEACKTMHLWQICEAIQKMV